MRNLKDIRDAAAKKDTELHIDKTAVKIAEEKRTEVVRLQTEIDKKKQEAEQSGQVIIDEARNKANDILRNAQNEEKQVKSLQETLNTRLREIEKRAEEQKMTQDTLDQEKSRLRASQEVVEADKQQIIEDKSDIMQVKEQVNGLFADLVALLGVAVDKVLAVDAIEKEQKDKIRQAVESADETIRLLDVKKQKLEDKEDYLERKDSQLDEKSVIIREQRVQLQMAWDELKKK